MSRKFPDCTPKPTVTRISTCNESLLDEGPSLLSLGLHHVTKVRCFHKQLMMKRQLAGCGPKFALIRSSSCNESPFDVAASLLLPRAHDETKARCLALETHDVTQLP